MFGASNSAITIAGTSVSLGGTTTALPSPGIIGGTTPAAAHFTTGSFTGQITSTLSTGTSPFSITSTTVVPNLNVSQLLGGTWAIPGSIGSTTPNSVAATSLSASGAVSGAGFTNYFASPPALGGSSPAPVTATTLISTGAATLDGTTIPASATLPVVIYHGTKTLSTASISPGGCNLDTVTATGVISSDTVKASSYADLSTVVGYQPSGPTLTFYPLWTSTNLISIKVCNNVGNPNPITPGTVNLNLEVTRP